MTYEEYLKTPKWRAIAKKRMQIDGHRCVMCGSRGTANNPLETHHVSYKFIYHEEGRIYEDLMTLCQICHKSLHRAMARVTGEDGRRGWKDNPNIPSIHAFNITGTVEIEFEEGEQ